MSLSVSVAIAGAGKSLCYQLAAHLLRPAVVLVISPLVSLMRDQLANLPAALTGAAITSHHGYSENQKALRLLATGKLNILYISPERLYDQGFVHQLKQAHASSDAPLAFACVDEAHCVSQWSHNFRPSYLRLSMVLHEELGVKTVLALTATATLQTERSVLQKLGLPRRGAVFRSSTIRPNLKLSVSVEVPPESTSNEPSRIPAIIEPLAESAPLTVAPPVDAHRTTGRRR